ncbi:hypothetical protein Nepgr_025957 [Nepenthes gracilis]|uniref:Cupin type-1 domain-containing protein n=1 Tax=Nepenthes gracilis TaxID=150966 RepID=A0AAD3T7F2_NEPGR|nr:hypothetical protein Nepgr_025957 [Nepenthes gracilis]
MSPHSSLIVFLCCCLFLSSLSANRINEDACGSVGRLVKKEERRVISSSEYGEISAVEIGDGTGKHYHLQFIRLDPNSLFLPVVLHAEMVFYVHTGTGRLSWTDDDDISQVKLRRGDVFRLRSGTIFYIQSSLEPERERLRINAIFANSDDDLEEPSVGVYSSINDLIRGFDKRVLQAAFKVPEEVIEELTSEAKAPAIVHAVPTGKKNLWEEEVLFVKAFLGMGNNLSGAENKKKNSKTFNFFNEDPDVENCNGWSKMVTRKNLHALRGSHIGVFMVNLTKVSYLNFLLLYKTFNTSKNSGFKAMSVLRKF